MISALDPSAACLIHCPSVVGASCDAGGVLACGLANKAPDVGANAKKTAAVMAIKAGCFISCLVKKFIVENRFPIEVDEV